MKQPVWILSRTRGRWSNGKHEISEEIILTTPWTKLKNMIEGTYGFEGVKLPCEKLFFDPPRPAVPEWQPLSLDEIIRILG